MNEPAPSTTTAWAVLSLLAALGSTAAAWTAAYFRLLAPLSASVALPVPDLRAGVSAATVLGVGLAAIALIFSVAGSRRIAVVPEAGGSGLLWAARLAAIASAAGLLLSRT